MINTWQEDSCRSIGLLPNQMAKLNQKGIAGHGKMISIDMVVVEAATHGTSRCDRTNRKHSE